MNQLEEKLRDMKSKNRFGKLIIYKSNSKKQIILVFKSANDDFGEVSY